MLRTLNPPHSPLQTINNLLEAEKKLQQSGRRVYLHFCRFLFLFLLALLARRCNRIIEHQTFRLLVLTLDSHPASPLSQRLDGLKASIKYHQPKVWVIDTRSNAAVATVPNSWPPTNFEVMSARSEEVKAACTGAKLPTLAGSAAKISATSSIILGSKLSVKLTNGRKFRKRF